jgi:hypothetical protein
MATKLYKFVLNGEAQKPEFNNRKIVLSGLVAG